MRRLIESVAEEIAQLLEEMSIEELEELIAYANGVLRRKKESLQARKKYRFYYEVTLDPRKGFPYVARLVWRDNKVEREFYNLKKQYGKKKVTVWGDFEASDGDIIEMRTGASWRNDYRAWYLVYKGKLYLLTWTSDSQGKKVVVDYLSGELTMEDLIDILKVNLNEPDFIGEVVE
jgi:DNA polymerase III delta prime subunit